MILERAIFVIKPGSSKADFAAAFAVARPHIESAKGFRKLEMRLGIENPDSYLLLVWWDTVDDHMKGFRESEAFALWRTHLGPFFASPPATEHYGDLL
jgi:heme-degrading monooxygenase HmoA